MGVSAGMGAALGPPEGLSQTLMFSTDLILVKYLHDDLTEEKPKHTMERACDSHL